MFSDTPTSVFSISSESVLLEAELEVPCDDEVAPPLEAGTAGLGRINPIRLSRVLTSLGISSSSDDESGNESSSSELQACSAGGSPELELLSEEIVSSSSEVETGILRAQGIAVLTALLGAAIAAELFLCVGLVLI